jgi:hypothetical protein
MWAAIHTGVRLVRQARARRAVNIPRKSAFKTLDEGRDTSGALLRATRGVSLAQPCGAHPRLLGAARTYRVKWLRDVGHRNFPVITKGVFLTIQISLICRLRSSG